MSRMSGVTPAGMHGRGGCNGWAAPVVVRQCSAAARPGYQSMEATEYEDEPDVLLAKVRLLATMLGKAKATVAYTGAGISTASGIKDYASKAADSVGCRPKPGSPLLAEPTLTHRVMVSLHRQNMLHHWVQQNHDGLPQKAGFPPEHLNEIHGAWFDPSNPVVPMCGTLRRDLYELLEEWEQRSDLVLALGTSLCGMNADSVLTSCARRASRGAGLGAVVVGLQRTVRDEDCTLRIFGRMDTVFELLRQEMQLSVDSKPYGPLTGKSKVGPDTFAVPYDKEGNKDSEDNVMYWNLQPGQKVRVTMGPGRGFEGEMLGKDAAGHYKIRLPKIRENHKDHGKVKQEYTLGSWWTQSAAAGLCSTLPVVNVNPRVSTLAKLQAERGVGPKPKPVARKSSRGVHADTVAARDGQQQLRALAKAATRLPTIAA